MQAATETLRKKHALFVPIPDSHGSGGGFCLPETSLALQNDLRSRKDLPFLVFLHQTVQLIAYYIRNGGLLCQWLVDLHGHNPSSEQYQLLRVLSGSMYCGLLLCHFFTYVICTIHCLWFYSVLVFPYGTPQRRVCALISLWLLLMSTMCIPGVPRFYSKCSFFHWFWCATLTFPQAFYWEGTLLCRTGFGRGYVSSCQNTPRYRWLSWLLWWFILPTFTPCRFWEFT